MKDKGKQRREGKVYRVWRAGREEKEEKWRKIRRGLGYW